MRGWTIRWIVQTSLPIDRWQCIAINAFPPRLVIRSECDVGKNRIAAQRFHGIGIGVGTRARRDAKEAGFRIDRIQTTVCTWTHPANVIADGPDFPTLFAIGFGWNEHGEVCFATGRWKRGGDVVRFAFRILDAENQHVLCQPTFGFRLVRGDAESVTFFAQ